MKIILLALGLMLTFTQCKKYEDNPSISLIPRDERVTQFWELQAAYENETNVTDDYEQYDLTIKDDGTVTLNAEYDMFIGNSAIDTEGTWVFKNNDQTIEFDFEDDSQDQEYQITKLTRKEFRIRELGSEREIYLKTK